jgi:hypothetical protein
VSLTAEGGSMVQSSTERNVASTLAVRMCLLFLLVSSALLLTGCATTNPDERDVFYSGWVDPHSNPLLQ